MVTKKALTRAELTPRTKKIIMVAVFLMSLLQNFNSNMFGIAGAGIVAELEGAQYYTLQFTIFTLVSGITIPLFANLGDIQGRRRWLVIGCAFFTVGMITIAAAPTMLIVLIGRTLVSVGQGIHSANFYTIMGEISNEKERPIFLSINTAGVGCAQIFAPILAGAFVDGPGWRMVFMFLTVVGTVATVASIVLIPTILTPYMERGETRNPDYAGAASIGIFGLSFLLIFTWGTSKGWLSTTLIVLYIVCIVSFVLFIKIEKTAKSPLMPFFLFKYRSFTMCMIAMVLYGPCCYTFSSYIANIGIGVMGLSSTNTGMFVTVHAIGCLIFSFIWAPFIAKDPRKRVKPILLLCMAGLTAFFFVMGLMKPGAAHIILYIAMFATGAFNVIVIPGMTQIVQRTMPHEYIGIGTSMLQFLMKLGGTFGLAIGGMVMTTTWNNGTSAFLSNSGLSEEFSTALGKSSTLLSTSGVEALRESAVAAGQGEIFDTALLAARNLMGSSLFAVITLFSVFLVVGILLIATVKNNEVPEEAQEKAV